MTRTMFDTTNNPADVIPANAEMVAGYVNGLYRSYAAVTARCPNAVHVSIAVTTAADADVLDIEQGDATPGDAPGWVVRQHARGNPKPSLYCEMSQAAEVISHCLAAGFKQHVDYELWIALYDDRPTPTGQGEAAKQYIDHGPHGENYDMSVVFLDGWPHEAIPLTHNWTFEEEPMSYPAPIPADGQSHSIPVPPPHAGGCQGGYGNVWLSLDWDDTSGKGDINSTIQARLVGVDASGQVYAIEGFGTTTPKEVVDVSRKRSWWVIPAGTQTVKCTNLGYGPTLYPMVEAEVKGVPAT